MNRITLPNEIMLGEVTRLLAEGHTVVMMAKGCSMLPFIVGDRDSVELQYNTSPKPGDIALCEIAPKHWVLHRIIAESEDGFILKGDGNLDSTERSRRDKVAGTVLNIRRPNGKMIDCLTPEFSKRSLRWRALPRVIRRYYLAIYRRLI